MTKKAKIGIITAAVLVAGIVLLLVNMPKRPAQINTAQGGNTQQAQSQDNSGIRSSLAVPAADTSPVRPEGQSEANTASTQTASSAQEGTQSTEAAPTEVPEVTPSPEEQQSQQQTANLPAAEATADNCTATLSSDNSWDNGSGKCYQYALRIQNNGTVAVNGWDVTMDFGTEVKLDQSWNGDYSVSGSTITAKPAEYNANIEPGQSVEIGFILSTSGTIGTPTVTFN